MSFLIQQTQAEARDAFTFSRQAEISGIRLTSGSFENRLQPNEEQAGLDVMFRLTPGEKGMVETSFFASTTFECAIVRPSGDGEEQEKPLITLQGMFLASYDLQEGYSPTEAEMDAFHKANVMFNAWPFFREFVQASAGRMSLPPPPVPFVRIQVISEPKEDLALEAPEL